MKNFKFETFIKINKNGIIYEYDLKGNTKIEKEYNTYIFNIYGYLIAEIQYYKFEDRKLLKREFINPFTDDKNINNKYLYYEYVYSQEYFKTNDKAICIIYRIDCEKMERIGCYEVNFNK